MKRWEIPWGADEVGAPMRPKNLAQLDGYLRKLGMLAEAGDTNFFHDFYRISLLFHTFFVFKM